MLPSVTPANPSQTSLPRQPIGATFAVAISVLGFVFAVQFLAVVWHFLPKLRQQMVESATVDSVAPAAETAAAAPKATPVATQDSAPQDTPDRPDPALLQRVNKLVEESDKAYRVGDFEAALRGLDEADSLLPNDVGIQLRKARAFESLDQKSEAAEAYQRVLELPNTPPQFRERAAKKLEQLGPSARSASPGQVNAVDGSGPDVRDEIGLQPGSTLGIVDARLREGNPGTKVLRIAIKSRPNVTIDTRQMKLHVFFYEKTDTGDIQLTESKVASQWISPPVNWADNEPELLDVTYMMPNAASSDGSGPREYFGYIVGIYYNGELQDTRAEPGNLAKKFPLPLYLTQNPQ